MVLLIHQLAAGLYLLAGIGAAAGLGLRLPLLTRLAVAGLAGGWCVHALGFALLHTLDPTPPLTDTGLAISFMAWIGTAAFLILLRRARVAGLVVLVAPTAFTGAFFGLLQLRTPGVATMQATGSVPHAHVLLASAGLALLGLAGMAGVLFLAEHRRLKRKRSLRGLPALPSLEALDRVNALALAVGFPLLTLGVVTGTLWVQTVHGIPSTGSLHELTAFLGWGVYAVLVALRFAAHHGARQCAASAVGGFVVLCFAVLGVGLLT